MKVYDSQENLETPIITTGGFNTTGFIISMISNAASMGIARGTNMGQRIGNRITLKSIEVVINFYPIGDINPIQWGAMFALVYDRQPNGALPTNAQQLFEAYIKGVPTAWGNPAVAGGFTNLVNSGRFVTLAKFRPSLTSVSANVAGVQFTPKQIHLFKKLNLPVEYTGVEGGTGYNAEIQKGQLLLIGYAGNTGYGCKVAHRVRYTDQ